PEDGAPWPWRIWRGERAVHGGWFGGGDRRGDGGWTEGVPDPDEPPRRGCEQLRARGRRIPAGERRQHTGGPERAGGLLPDESVGRLDHRRRRGARRAGPAGSG